MFNLINVNPKRHGKDCADWCPLKDGTATGDIKYCDLSQYCRQIGMKTDCIIFLTMKPSSTTSIIFVLAFTLQKKIKKTTMRYHKWMRGYCYFKKVNQRIL